MWASSLFEEKVSRAVFWLECFKANQIVDLPGQGTKLRSRLGNLNKLLHDNSVAGVLGQDGVKFVQAEIARASKSLCFRDDVVHGHHLGGWSEATILRVRGKTFKKNQTDFVKLSARAMKRHGNVILAAAAVVALIDHYFDEAYNG